MVREAGGTVGDINGGDVLKTGDIVCGNETIHAELARILKPLS